MSENGDGDYNSSSSHTQEEQKVEEPQPLQVKGKGKAKKSSTSPENQDKTSLVKRKRGQPKKTLTTKKTTKKTKSAKSVQIKEMEEDNTPTASVSDEDEDQDDDMAIVLVPMRNEFTKLFMEMNEDDSETSSSSGALAPRTWKDIFTSLRDPELEARIKTEEEAILEYQKKHAFDYETQDIRRQILLMNADIAIKSQVLKKYDEINGKKGGIGVTGADKSKFQAWIRDVLTIPFNKTLPLPVTIDDGAEKIKTFLDDVKVKLDKAVAGHDHVKDEIVDYIARIISNPQGKGQVLALSGSRGVGKTRLIKKGVAEALGRPFHVINLGGLNDVHVLTGHDVTYSGSKYGRLAQILIQSKCDNPVVYLDEIDKIQANHEKGMEIFRVLTHVLDEEQNYEFFDEYFGGIKIDLSKILFVASLNNPDDVEPVLRDRLKLVHLNKLDNETKINIGFTHVLPELLDIVKIDPKAITFPRETMRYLVTQKTVQEDGCRQMKKKIETIIQKLNTMKITQTGYFQDGTGTLEVTTAVVDDLLKHENDEIDSYSHMYS